MFAEIDQFADDDVILASSTSCIVPSKFTSDLSHKTQCIVAHPVRIQATCITCTHPTHIHTHTHTNLHVHVRSHTNIQTLSQAHVHTQSKYTCMYIHVQCMYIQPTAPVLKAGHPGVLFFVVGLFSGCLLVCFVVARLFVWVGGLGVLFSLPSSWCVRSCTFTYTCTC